MTPSTTAVFTRIQKAKSFSELVVAGKDSSKIFRELAKQVQPDKYHTKRDKESVTKAMAHLTELYYAFTNADQIKCASYGPTAEDVVERP
jgi:hypothetical protein